MSAASWWELGIKNSLGRLDFDAAEMRKAIDKRGVTGISVTISHAEVAAALPRLHGDPFDHMLVAQAVAEGLILLTRDGRLEVYGSSVLCV